MKNHGKLLGYKPAKQDSFIGYLLKEGKISIGQTLDQVIERFNAFSEKSQKYACLPCQEAGQIGDRIVNYALSKDTLRPEVKVNNVALSFTDYPTGQWVFFDEDEENRLNLNPYQVLPTTFSRGFNYSYIDPVSGSFLIGGPYNLEIFDNVAKVWRRFSNHDNFIENVNFPPIHTPANKLMINGFPILHNNIFVLTTYAGVFIYKLGAQDYSYISFEQEFARNTPQKVLDNLRSDGYSLQSACFKHNKLLISQFQQLLYYDYDTDEVIVFKVDGNGLNQPANTSISFEDNVDVNVHGELFACNDYGAWYYDPKTKVSHQFAYNTYYPRRLAGYLRYPNRIKGYGITDTGILYAAGSEYDQYKEVWFYDIRNQVRMGLKPDGSGLQQPANTNFAGTTWVQMYQDRVIVAERESFFIIDMKNLQLEKRWYRDLQNSDLPLPGQPFSDLIGAFDNVSISDHMIMVSNYACACWLVTNDPLNKPLMLMDSDENFRVLAGKAGDTIHLANKEGGIEGFDSKDLIEIRY